MLQKDIWRRYWDVAALHFRASALHIYCYCIFKLTVIQVRLTYLYNVLYSVNTQKYSSTMILYIHSDHIMTTCFDRKRSSSGQ